MQTCVLDDYIEQMNPMTSRNDLTNIVTEVSATNSAIIQSLQFTLNKVFFKLFGSLPKECYTEINYYFGIGLIEEIVRKRREQFVSGYVASDNCLCRLLFRRC